jgi:hypothetical protein
MARGGARNRSGPQPDEDSGRSDARGYSLTALPPAGYDAEAPDFPLPATRKFRWEFEDKRKFQVFDADETEAARERESDLWAQVWTTPQACAWSLEPWRWNTVAMYVRTFVVCEGSDATAADKGSLHRFGDQIGLTPAGLKENGWKIAEPKSASSDTPADEADDEDDPRNRLSVVRDGTGG